MKELIVELKAKVEDHTYLREKLLELGASYRGIFNQIDTYFKALSGRLKIRVTEGEKDAQIVYYERSDVPSVKTSHIILVKAHPKENVMDMFKKIFRIHIVVDKIREIFMLNGTQIHLDRVTNLGFFIEFERPTRNESHEIHKSKEILDILMRRLNISEERLESFSYSDLLSRKVTS
jgi:predicted adenylyl cyclase CyaB